jgi:biopolymer transport protein ExbB/TolQ
MIIMDMIFTGDQIFLLILAIIFLIAVIVIAIEWRKASVSKNDIKLLEKQAELKKIEIVEKDLQNKQKKENLAELSEEDQNKLKEIRANTSQITAKVDLLSSQVNERVDQLEAKKRTSQVTKTNRRTRQKRKRTKQFVK